MTGWVWPVPGYPGKGTGASRYGWRTHPITGERQFHRGEDVAAPDGTPMVAAVDGTVALKPNNGGAGHTLDLYAAGVPGVTRVRYFHCRRFLVAGGTRVRAGQPIAECGRTGGATGPHLHLEVWDGRTHRDPRLFIRYSPAPVKETDVSDADIEKVAQRVVALFRGADAHGQDVVGRLHDADVQSQQAFHEARAIRGEVAEVKRLVQGLAAKL